MCEMENHPCLPISRLLFGVVYWYLWTKLIPSLAGYHLEEENGLLSDGTTVTRLVKIKDS